MDDYIKREDALSLVQHSDFDTEDDKNYIMLILGKEYGCPSADVVEVVRCGDCLFCQMELGEGADEPWCDIHHTTVDIEAFCSWGERRRHED